MRTAGFFVQQQDWSEAQRHFDAALLVAEEHFGPGDPRYRGTINGLLDLYDERGNFGRGALLLEQVLPEIEATTPGLDAELGSLHSRFGGYLHREGRFEESARAHARAIRILEQAGDPIPLGRAFHRAAALDESQGRLDDATNGYGRALVLLEANLPEDDLSLARLRADLAGLLLRRRRLHRARALIERALPVLQNELRGHDPELIRGFGFRTILRLELGSADLVEEDLSRFYNLYDYGSVSEKARSRRLLGRIADACERNGLDEDAVRLLARLLHFERAHGDPESPEAARLLFRLGVLKRRTGELRQAEALLRRSLVAYENHPLDFREELARVRAEHAAVTSDLARLGPTLEAEMEQSHAP